MLKVVSDELIPAVADLFGDVAEIISKPGLSIKREDLVDVDILLVRTVTKVGEKLLQDTAVKWVGSATAGIDHVDLKVLKQLGISFAYAPGCNANAVSEYILYCIAALRSQGRLLGKALRAGVVGVGNCGQPVYQKLKDLGFEVMVNDPPRALRDPNFQSTPLAEFNNLDLICLHLPHITEGSFPTHHLIDKNFLARQKPETILINAGRGEVVDSSALQQSSLISCLDVWENEPNISLETMNHCVIATPHIAGYSVEAKYRATFMIYQQAAEFFNWPELKKQQYFPQPRKINIGPTRTWEQELLALYNPLQHTQEMKNLLNAHPKEVAIYFEKLRRNYNLRHEFS